MGGLPGPEPHTGVVEDRSNSGNPVLTDPDWDKRVILTGDRSDIPNLGDEVMFAVQREHADHYQAVIAFQTPDKNDSSGESGNRGASGSGGDYQQTSNEDTTPPVVGQQYTGTVTRLTNNGNAAITKEHWDNKVIVVVDGDLTVGTTIDIAIKKDNGDHYLAVKIGEGSLPVDAPDYPSKPNIPLHHDGKYGQSVGDTRSEAASLDPNEEEFDPETHGAPKPSREQRSRSFLRSDK